MRKGRGDVGGATQTGPPRAEWSTGLAPWPTPGPGSVGHTPTWKRRRVVLVCWDAAGWSLAVNGIGALATCLPECDRSELYVGVGNSVLGAAAAGASWWAIRREPSPVRLRAALISGALVAAALAAKEAI